MNLCNKLMKHTWQSRTEKSRCEPRCVYMLEDGIPSLETTGTIWDHIIFILRWSSSLKTDCVIDYLGLTTAAVAWGLRLARMWVCIDVALSKLPMHVATNINL